MSGGTAARVTTTKPTSTQRSATCSATPRRACASATCATSAPATGDGGLVADMLPPGAAVGSCSHRPGRHVPMLTGWLRRTRGCGCVVADDHPFFRDGVARGLTQSGRFEVVAEVGDGRAALEVIRREAPDVALVDYEMPDVDGLGVVRGRGPGRVAHPGAAAVRAHRQRGGVPGPAGGSGWLPVQGRAPSGDRRGGRSTWPAAGRWCPAELAAGLAGEIRLRAQAAGPALSERERQVLQAFARGLSVPQVAGRALPRGEHGEDPHPAALREARGVRPGGGRSRGHAPRPGGVACPRVAAGTSRAHLVVAVGQEVRQGLLGGGVQHPGRRHVRVPLQALDRLHGLRGCGVIGPS